MNKDFAAKIVEGAKAEIDAKNLKDSRKGFGSETYYSIDIPYPAGSEQHAYFTTLLGSGSIKNPDYMDLFGLVTDGLTKALGDRAFLTLNCRFDLNAEDNFLLYVFLS